LKGSCIDNDGKNIQQLEEFIPCCSWCFKVSLSLLSWLFVFLAEVHLYACYLACKIEGLTQGVENIPLKSEMAYMNTEGSF